VQIVDRPFAPLVLGAIAAGGAIGSSGRWGVAELVDAAGTAHMPGTWPWATLVVNVIGCLLIGLAARTLSAGTVAWAFGVTGVLGGFTTFSALAVELNDLADAERFPVAVLYGAVTLAAGVGATFVAHRPIELGE
jgi:CrcB protein